jgi:hypothetical protein
MQYFKGTHGGKTAIARLVPRPLGETSLADTASPSRLAF